jgi:DNA polymerase-3 subunit delta'
VSLAGHDEPWREWQAALAGPRLHHGWILSGKRGTGKAAFALAAARELVAEPGVPQPKGDHPDIITLEPLPATADDEKKREEGKPYQTKRNIAVDQVRAMQQRLTTRPTLGARRAIIVDPADDMEKGAVNALLKSLEEPPTGAVFLLVAHRPGRLLPTIRSRCRMMRFQTLEDDVMTAALTQALPDVPAAERARLIGSAEGSPGQAIATRDLDLPALEQSLETIAAHERALRRSRASAARSIRGDGAKVHCPADARGWRPGARAGHWRL